MGVPQKVLDAEAEADRLIGSISAPTSDGDDPTPDPDKDQPGADDQKTGESGEPAPDGEPQSKEGEGEKPTPSGDNAEVEQLRAQVADLQAQLTKLQAAHDTLRGKTYAEVPRTLAENKSLRDRVTALEAENSTLKQGAPPAQATGKVTGKAVDILKSLKEDVNEDVADRIQQLVEAVVEDRVSQRVKTVESSVESLRNVDLENRQNQYLRALTEKVPDWRNIANDPEYSTFLSQADEFSGKTLYDMAADALDHLDADRMSRFFMKYKASKNGGGDGAAASTGKPAGKEALIAPKGAAKTGQRAVAEGEKPDYITTKQLEQFSKDRKKMDPDEEAKMEARIDKAIQKGWVVPV